MANFEIAVEDTEGFLSVIEVEGECADSVGGILVVLDDDGSAKALFRSWLYVVKSD
jgi:hypothetical protein